MKKIFLVILNLVVAMVLLTGCGVDLTKNDKIEISINPGVDTVEIFTTFDDRGATATFGSRLVAVATESTVDTSKIGSYTVTYTAIYNGQKATAVRKVEVKDQTAPILSLNPGVDTIKVGTEWTDAGVSSYDNSLGEVTVTVESTLDNKVVGEYIITYKGVDPSGNTSSIIRYVNVIE